MWIFVRAYKVLLAYGIDIFNSVAAIFDHVILTPGHVGQV